MAEEDSKETKAPTTEAEETTAAAAEGESAPASGGDEKKVEMPQLPPRMPKPDKAAYENSKNELEREIEAAKKKRELLIQRIRVAESGNAEGSRNRRGELRSKMGTLVRKAKELRAAKQKLIEKQRAFREIQEKRRNEGKKLREGSRYKDAGSVDQAIERLMYRQSTQSLTLNEEKDLLKQIAELNTMKQRLEEFSAQMAQLDKHKAEGRSISELIDGKSAEIDVVSKEISGVKSELDEMDRKRAASQGKIKPMREEFNALRKLVNDKYDELRKMKDDWRKVNDEFYQHMQEVRKVRQKIRRIEEAQERAEREARREAWEAEQAKIKPWLREIALCDTLSTHLRGMLPTEEQKAEAAPAAPAAAAPGSGLDEFSGMTILRKDSGMEAISIGTKKKKQKKNRKRRKQKQAALEYARDIRHDMTTISSFTYLAKHSKRDLPPPITTDDIPSTLEILAEIRAYYDTLPREVKTSKSKSKKGGASKGEAQSFPYDMDTAYGTASVTERRGDGVLVADLPWGKLYTQG